MRRGEDQSARPIEASAIQHEFDDALVADDPAEATGEAISARRHLTRQDTRRRHTLSRAVTRPLVPSANRCTRGPRALTINRFAPARRTRTDNLRPRRSLLMTGPIDPVLLEQVKTILRRDLRLGADATIADDMPLVGGPTDLDSIDILLLVSSLEKALSDQSAERGRRAHQRSRALMTLARSTCRTIAKRCAFSRAAIGVATDVSPVDPLAIDCHTGRSSGSSVGDPRPRAGQAGGRRMERARRRVLPGRPFSRAGRSCRAC